MASKKGQPFLPGSFHDALGQRLRGEGPCRNDREPCFRQGINSLTHHFDIGMRLQRLLDLGGEDIAIHRHGTARGHLRNFACAHYQAVERAHLIVQKTDGVFGIVVGAKTVRTHQFGQAVGLVRVCHFT